MTKVVVQHHVEDYERWYRVFTERGEVRKSQGAAGHSLYRAQDDPNTIVIVTAFSSADGARASLKDPSLKEAMGRAGVDSDPQIWIVDEVESVSY